MTRPILSAALLAGLLVGAAPSGRLSAEEASPYGVNAHAPSGADLVPLLDAVQAARIGWIRVDFAWSSVEPARGARDFLVYDAIVREARARGVEVYAEISGTPAWATDGPPEAGVPRSVAEWRSFVAESARRYRGRVKAWGVWNEPNLASFWAGTRAQYVDVLLRPAAEEIRKADPDALVCGPDLAHLTGGGADWYGWLLDVLVEAGGVLDVVTHHVYDRGDNGDVKRKLDASTTFGGRPQYWDLVSPSVIEVLREAGAEDKPFWLTETGWASDEVGEEVQSRNLVELLRDWFGRPGGPSWVRKVFLYELVDDGREGIARYGLLRPDRSPKMAYRGVSTFNSAYRPYGDAAELVTVEVPESVEVGATKTARLTFRNSGRATWTLDAGHALAPLDDAAFLSAGRVPLPSGRPVATGETVTFSFPLSPLRAGTFRAAWRLVTEEGGPFGPVVERTITATGACGVPAAPEVAAAPAGRVAAGALAAFSWSEGEIPGPARFRVQLLDLPPFAPTAVLVDSEVSGTSFGWRVPATPGRTLGFRVAAVNGCGVAGPFSATSVFSVATAPARLAPTRGQGAPWLVRSGEAAPTSLLAFRNVGGEPAVARFDVTDDAFAVTPLSATIAPGEEQNVLLSARAGATLAAGVRTGRVVASFAGGSASISVGMAVAPDEVGGARVTVSPQSVTFLAPGREETLTAELTVTNPGTAAVLLVPMIEPGGAWLSVASPDLTAPIPPGATRRVGLVVDRRRRTPEDGFPPVRTVLSLVAAGGEARDRADLPVVDAEPFPRSPSPGRGPVPSGTSSWVVPTAVQQGGALGQAFSSALEIRNFGGVPAAVDVYSATAGADGEREALRASVPVPAAGTVVLDEALPVLFGRSFGAAHLELRSASALAVRSVVTGTSPAGDRFSAEIPVVAAGEGTGARRPPLLLPGLGVTRSRRCNVVLAETTGVSERVALRLFDENGRALGRGEVLVPAWGNAQLELAAAVGRAGLVPEASSLRVEPLDGAGRVVALATIIDNASASFSVVTGRPAPQDGEDGAGPQATASIVQSPGLASFFTTELSIATAAPRRSPLKLTYEFAGTGVDGAPVRGRVGKDVVLPRDGALPIGVGRNVVGSLFGQDPRSGTSGTLRIEGDGAGRVIARATVATPLDLGDPSRGVMSAEIPAVGPESPEAIGNGAPHAVVLAGLRAWTRERVNLIVSEVSGAPARVVLSLLGDGDVRLGEREVAVGPFEKVQWNDLWNGPSGFGLGSVPADRLTLVASGSGESAGRVVLAVTTVDNVTNGMRVQMLAPAGPARLGGPSGR